MAETPKNPLVLDSFDKKHLQQIAALENKVAAIYAELCKEVGVVGTLFGGKVDLEKVFKLGDYPEINKKVDQIITTLHDRLGSAIVDGVTAQWQLANEKNDNLVQKVFGKDLDNLTEDQITRYFTSNQSALDAFLKRKDKGIGLSQKVWKYAKEAKVDIESALELGIKTGQSAASMARDLKQYLKEPDKLFRRVRDKDGKLHLSKAAQAYHPGQGVYRSSYKNALRLAVTEANMAYRASDYERVQNFDFVVGIEVKLSNNHTLNGKPFYDICDELKGKYPKDFKFRGWHPFCRCHAITILKTREELMADNQRILDGQEPTEDSVNSVNDLPDNFKAWAVKNKSRILAADKKGTLPYFITDNPYSVNSAIGQPLASVKVPLWYAHNAQVKEVQSKLKEIKQWSYDHPKSKKIVGLINDTDAAISNGAAIEDILARFEAANKEYKGKLWEAEYVAKKKAEAVKKPTALDIAKKRHEARTQQQIDQTKYKWGMRRLDNLNSELKAGYLPEASSARIMELAKILDKGHYDEFNRGADLLSAAVKRHKKRTPEYIDYLIKEPWDRRRLMNFNQALTDGILPTSAASIIQDLEDHIIFGEHDLFVKKANALQAQVNRRKARTAADIADIKDRWDTRRLNNVIERFKGLPHPDSYIPSDLAGISKYADELYDFYELNPAAKQMFLGYRKTVSDFQDAIEDMYKVASLQYGSVTDFIARLQTIDITKYPPQAREGVFKIAQLCLSHGYERKYYNVVANQIEGLKNIEYLVQHKVDFSKVSYMTPKELLSSGKWFDSCGVEIHKDFFDKFPEFVPVTIHKGKGTSCFHPGSRTVDLYMGDSRYASPKYRGSLVYHEFGHALDTMYELSKKTKTIDTMDVLKNYFEKQVTQKNLWTGKMETAPRWVFEAQKISELSNNAADWRRFGLDSFATMSSELSAWNDVLQTMTMGKCGFNGAGGHKLSYWNAMSVKKEFLAHCFENYFIGNHLMRTEDRYLFDMMRTLIEQLF